MTVASDNSKQIYSGNGVATEFTIPFTFLEADHLQVYIVDPNNNMTLLNTGYEIDVENSLVIYPYNSSTTPILQTGYQLIIYRNVPTTQETSLKNQGAFLSKTIEASLDKLTMISQQQNESIDRTLKLAINTPGGINNQLPAPSAGMGIGWDETGLNLINMTPAQLIDVDGIIMTPLQSNIVESTGYGVISGLEVSAESTPDMTVQISTGIVHMPNGKRFELTTSSTIVITAADSSLSRIDSIYVNSAGSIIYAQGTAAASPVVPVLPSGALLLANVNIPAGTITITSSSISSQRQIKTSNTNTQIVNTTMTQSEIQNALNKGGTVRFLSGEYDLGFQLTFANPICLDIQSNTNVIMDKDVVIKCNTNNYTSYYILNADGKINVSIENGTVVGDKLTHTGTDGEWGFGVRIYNSINIHLKNVTSTYCWGDGFYIGGNSINVVIDDCISDSNRRNGLSISSGQYVYINRGKYINTSGTNPQAGIDIEPNLPTDIIKYIFLNKVYVGNNANGSGIEINIAKLACVAGTPDNVAIFIDSAVSEGNIRGFAYTCSSTSAVVNTVKGFIRVTNLKLKNNISGLSIFDVRDQIMPTFDADTIEIRGWSTYAFYVTTAGVDSASSSNIVAYGGVKIRNFSMYEPPATLPSPAVAMIINPTTYRKFNAILENVYVDSLTPDQWLYWSSGDGKVTYKSQPILSSNGLSYVYMSGISNTFSVDTTLALPAANMCKDREFTLTHIGQSNICRIAPSGSDVIAGITNAVSGITSVISVNGARVTVKSDGVSTWNVVNSVGRIAPVGFQYDRRTVYANAVPTTGTWNSGDRVICANPVVGSPKSWVCNTGGTPGTWVSEGNL